VRVHARRRTGRSIPTLRHRRRPAGPPTARASRPSSPAARRRPLPGRSLSPFRPREPTCACSIRRGAKNLLEFSLERSDSPKCRRRAPTFRARRRRISGGPVLPACAATWCSAPRDRRPSPRRNHRTRDAREPRDAASQRAGCCDGAAAASRGIGGSRAPRAPRREAPGYPRRQDRRRARGPSPGSPTTARSTWTLALHASDISAEEGQAFPVDLPARDRGGQDCVAGGRRDPTAVTTRASSEWKRASDPAALPGASVPSSRLARAPSRAATCQIDADPMGSKGPAGCGVLPGELSFGRARGSPIRRDTEITLGWPDSSKVVMRDVYAPIPHPAKSLATTGRPC